MPMHLILFRHGIAEDHSSDGSDAARALTAEGVRKTQAAAVGLATMIEPPQVILTSPKVRAKQTAAILGRVFKVESRDEPALAEESLDKILAAVARRGEEVVILVGHEPTLSSLIHHLVAGRAPVTGRDSVELKKAGAASLTVTFGDSSTPSAILHWLLTPKVLRSLGDTAA